MFVARASEQDNALNRKASDSHFANRSISLIPFGETDPCAQINIAPGSQQNPPYPRTVLGQVTPSRHGIRLAPKRLGGCCDLERVVSFLSILLRDSKLSPEGVLFLSISRHDLNCLSLCIVKRLIISYLQGTR